MKLTTTQLKKIIAEEIRKARPQHNLAENSNAEIEYTKEALMRSLSSASAELSNLAELTNNPAYQKAGDQLTTLMDLLENL